MTNVGYICGDCGSTNLVYDASARWDTGNQRMELSSTYDHCDCLDCERENGQIEVDMETYKKALEREVKEDNPSIIVMSMDDVADGGLHTLFGRGE